MEEAILSLDRFHSRRAHHQLNLLGSNRGEIQARRSMEDRPNLLVVHPGRRDMMLEGKPVDYGWSEIGKKTQERHCDRS